jgi:hypothetical protein
MFIPMFSLPVPVGFEPLIVGSLIYDDTNNIRIRLKTLICIFNLRRSNVENRLSWKLESKRQDVCKS